MNKAITNISNAIDSFFVDYNKRYNQVIEDNFKGVIVDNLGRLHAPYDGYKVNGKSYKKGEYVAENIQEELGKGVYKARILINASLADNILSIIDDHEVGFASTGKVWDKNGKKYCYLYLQVFFKSIITIIENAVKDVEEDEKDAVLLTAGKYKVEATLVKVEEEYNHNKYYTSSRLKATFVTDEGAILKGTLPKALEDFEYGVRVEFEATFEPHTFVTVYKRPSKVKVLNKQ